LILKKNVAHFAYTVKIRTNIKLIVFCIIDLRKMLDNIPFGCYWVTVVETKTAQFMKSFYCFTEEVFAK